MACTLQPSAAQSHHQQPRATPGCTALPLTPSPSTRLPCHQLTGVTQRRWLAFCNPPLRNLITSSLKSDDWIRDLYKLKGLAPLADDPAFQQQWQQVKVQAKDKAAALIERLTGGC